MKTNRTNTNRTNTKPAPQSGYTPCACRDCMEIAVSDDMANPDFCHECEEAGCEGGRECQVEHMLEEELS